MARSTTAADADDSDNSRIGDAVPKALLIAMIEKAAKAKAAEINASIDDLNRRLDAVLTKLGVDLTPQLGPNRRPAGTYRAQRVDSLRKFTA